jgi:leader peptidase (prepilin peptidase) / N-methyltransferase
MVVLLWAVAGLFVGAVLNHLADRLPLHKSILGAPDCGRCGSPRPVREWPALVGRLLGRDRCPACGASWPVRRYALEASLALLYAALAVRYGLSLSLAIATLHISVLTLVVVCDLEHHLVPDAAVLPAFAVTLAIRALVCWQCLPNALLGTGIGLGLFVLLALVGGMGLGDVKLAGYVGLLVGFPRIVTSLAVTFISGGVVAGLLLATRRVGRRSYIPYGPFLAIGAALALFLP